MERALPVGSEHVAVNPAFSALAALGLEESVVQMGPADAPILMDVADAIPDVVAPAATNTDLESPVTAAIASVKVVALHVSAWIEISGVRVYSFMPLGRTPCECVD